MRKLACNRHEVQGLPAQGGCSDLLGHLVDVIAEAVVERLVPCLEANARGRGGAVYTSKSLPPGVSKRVFHEVCRRSPAARRDGRLWVIDVEDYERTRYRRPAPKAASPANDDDVIVMSALAKAGLRAVAGGSR